MNMRSPNVPTPSEIAHALISGFRIDKPDRTAAEICVLATAHLAESIAYLVAQSTATDAARKLALRFVADRILDAPADTSGATQ